MKVLVISDTHRRIKRVEHLIAFYEKMGGIDYLVHCGDHIGDGRELQKKYPSIKMHMVPGNCDIEECDGDTSLLVEVGGVPILIAHGHKHHVKYNYEELYIDAKAHEAKVVLFGHTHSALKEKKDGILLLNPGSLSEPRDTTYPSFGLIDIEKGEVKNAAILQLTGVERISLHPYF